ncbi:MAG: hypothetical protein JWP52_372 [Rhizobacter sp.]|nr:hypothetical protein [Rhizobacter sp.]
MKLTHKKTLAWAAAMAFVMAAPLAQANQVLNGGFESGDFAGWTQSGDPADFVAVDGFAAHSGNSGAAFGSTDPSGISQSFATVAGQSYTVDFWLMLQDSAQPNAFSWSWNGAAQEPNLSNVAGFGFQEFSFTMTAAGTSSSLAFNFLNPQSYWLIDDISVNASVAAVPEPETYALMGAGLMLVAGMVHRRRKAG